MQEVYIHSTLTNGQNYIVYAKIDKTAMNQTVNHIAKDKDGKEIVLHVNGGANRASKALITVDGVVTETTKELVDLVRENSELFRIHENNGFIKVTDYHKKNVKDLEKKDASAQLTPEDFKKKGRGRPKTKSEAEATSGDDGE